MDDELRRLADESTRSTRASAYEVSHREIPALTIAGHPDPSRVGQRLVMTALLSSREVELSRTGPGFAALDGPPHPLADLWMSRKPWVFTLIGDGGIRIERRDSGTTMVVDGAEVDTMEVDAERLRRGVVLLLAGRIVLVLHRVRLLPSPKVSSFGMVGESCDMLALRQQIERVGPLDVPVLLRGATGTGKELIASALHRSGRRDRRFVAVNMAALSPSLAAAELFGSVKGAYTGADRSRQGFFRQADGGTLFLDEIGDTPAEVQALLLRALETGEVQPVGSDRPVPVEVRLIAATDADLDKAVASDRFRAPLLHRLGGFQIQVPALVDRREDVGRLLYHFLGEELRALAKDDLLLSTRDREDAWLSGPAVARLVRYDWPGNVRQLRNTARQLAITCHDQAEITAATVDVLLAVSGETTSSNRLVATAEPTAWRRKPSEIDDDELVATLREHRFNLRAVAAAFGISRTSLYTRIDRCQRLRKASSLNRAEIEAALVAAGGDPDAAAATLEVSSLAFKRRLKELEAR